MMYDVDEEDSPRTYCLSPFFSPIVEKLLWVTDREDAGSSNLRAAAYEALMETVKNSPKVFDGRFHNQLQFVFFIILGA